MKCLNIKLDRVNDETGEVILLKNLDREAISAIKVIIEAHDKAGLEKKIGETILDITVSDENDNAPSIYTGIIVTSHDNKGRCNVTLMCILRT